MSSTSLFFRLSHPNHLGSIEWVTNADGRPVEYFWYSPWGETLHEDNSWRGRFRSPFKFTGHVEDEETGLTYAGARYYPARVGKWLSVDPLAHLYPAHTPYNYVMNNPVNLIDPDGRAAGSYRDEQGNELGTDGIDDKKVYILKSNITPEQRDNVVGDPNQPKSFNPESSEVQGSFFEFSVPKESRQEMVDIVSQDDGRGRGSDANNREYGGVVDNNNVVTQQGPGPVIDLRKDVNATINLTVDENTKHAFHSHPSGYKILNDGRLATHSQTPSPADIGNAGDRIDLIFSRSNGHKADGGTVHFYDRTGVVGSMSTRRFLSF